VVHADEIHNSERVLYYLKAKNTSGEQDVTI